MTRTLGCVGRSPGQTGTKEGCGEGECGACSVLVDGEVVVSCLVPVCQVERRAVTTIEGIAEGKKKLAALQKSFLACGGTQCGICTPGMIVAASALPRRPALDEVRAGLAGNLCRCTGYEKIYDAVLAALGGEERRRPLPKKSEKKLKKAKRNTKTVAARRGRVAGGGRR